jgi:hypothetical protein
MPSTTRGVVRLMRQSRADRDDAPSPGLRAFQIHMKAAHARFALDSGLYTHGNRVISAPVAIEEARVTQPRIYMRNPVLKCRPLPRAATRPFSGHWVVMNRASDPEIPWLCPLHCPTYRAAPDSETRRRAHESHHDALSLWQQSRLWLCRGESSRTPRLFLAPRQEQLEASPSVPQSVEGPQQMVLLHGFIKKTRQTSVNDLDLAVKRQKEVEGGKAAK